MNSRAVWEPEVRKCRNCGRAFGMLHPTRWAYKRPKGARYEYFCSWGCLRADEKKGSEEMRGEITIKPEQKARALEMAMAGESPLPYLKECGAANPSATWNYIRNCAVRDDPMKYEGKLPATFGHKKKEEPEVELVYDPTIAEEYRREQAQKEANERVKAETIKKVMDLPAIKATEHKQDRRNLWTTTAIRNDYLGVFYYDRKYNTVDWRHPAGEEISLPPADWNLLANALPEIMRTLGVDQQEIEMEV